VGGGSAAGLGGGRVVVDAVAELGGEVGGLFIGDLRRWAVVAGEGAGERRGAP
jgi:hypothetical protein